MPGWNLYPVHPVSLKPWAEKSFYSMKRLSDHNRDRAAGIDDHQRCAFKRVAVGLRHNPATTLTPGQRGNRPSGSAAPESKAANVPGFSNKAT
jgi:hypothetical protein